MGGYGGAGPDRKVCHRLGNARHPGGRDIDDKATECLCEPVVGRRDVQKETWTVGYPFLSDWHACASEFPADNEGGGETATYIHIER